MIYQKLIRYYGRKQINLKFWFSLKQCEKIAAIEIIDNLFDNPVIS